MNETDLSSKYIRGLGSEGGGGSGRVRAWPNNIITKVSLNFFKIIALFLSQSLRSVSQIESKMKLEKQVYFPKDGFQQPVLEQF